MVHTTGSTAASPICSRVSDSLASPNEAGSSHLATEGDWQNIPQTPSEFQPDDLSFALFNNTGDFPLESFGLNSNLEDLETLLNSGKRNAQEAFGLDFELFCPPDKRSSFQLSPNKSVTAVQQPPSLSSPGSSRTSQPTETVLNTPADIERLHTPDSLFDSDEPLVDVQLPPDESVEKFVSTLPSLQESTAPDGSSAHAVETRTPSVVEFGTAPDYLPELGTENLPLVASKVTEQNFCLEPQDLIVTSMRDVLRRPDKEPEYRSPYPPPGGTLGYLPSSPALHVRYVDTTEEAVQRKIAEWEAKAKQLRYERNKYKNAWRRLTSVDPTTGKAMDETLKEEITKLRRKCTIRERKIENVKSEAEHYKSQSVAWQGAYRNLAITYNRLLSDYEQLQRGILTVPIYTPMVGPPRPVAPEQRTAVSAEPTPAPRRDPTSPSTAVPPITSNDETDTSNSSEHGPHPSPALDNPGSQLLGTFRKKRYAWLEGEDYQARGYSTPAFTASEPGAANRHESSVGDDELARLMEQELARG